jgi:hypothetical protein
MCSYLPIDSGHLQQQDEQLVRLGMPAERYYFAQVPNTYPLTLWQLTDAMAQPVDAGRATARRATKRYAPPRHRGSPASPRSNRRRPSQEVPIE